MTAGTDGAAGLRPFGVAELLDGAVRTVRRNLRTVLIISAPFAVVRTVSTALLQLGLSGSTSTLSLTLLDLVLVVGALGTVLSGLLAPVFTDELLGRRLTARQSLARVGWRWILLVVLAVAIAVPETVGMFALGVGGLWLWGVWAVAAPALVVERMRPFAALGRSFNLVRGEFWRTWGVRALGFLLTTVLGFFVAIPFQVLAALVSDFNPFDSSAGNPAYPTLFVWISAIGGLATALLLGPVTAAIDALLYVDLRMRREGLDILLSLPPEPQVGQPAAVSAW